MRATVNGQTRDFIYDLSGRNIDEFTPGGSGWLGTWTRGEAYAGSLHIATYANGTTQFDNSDWLSTFRARSDVTGNVVETCTSLPFGEDLTCTGTEVTPIHFTGKERDAESGNDFFGARYYTSTMGRFLTPDPLQPNRSHPLLLQQFVADPQSWNKYAYALNDPIKDTDQSGHFTGDDHERIQTNAMLANGYSPAATHIAATADRSMDNAANMASGVPILHHFTSDAYQNRENPQHGEAGDHQTREQAEGVANAFMSSKINDAAARALQGDVRGALTDIGQASHTGQDIVRHDFETASQHPYGEAPATSAEMKAATQATQNVLDQFTSQVYQQGLQQGLGMNQIIEVMGNMQRGIDQQSPGSSINSVGGESDSQ